MSQKLQIAKEDLKTIRSTHITKPFLDKLVAKRAFDLRMSTNDAKYNKSRHTRELQIKDLIESGYLPQGFVYPEDEE